MSRPQRGRSGAYEPFVPFWRGLAEMSLWYRTGRSRTLWRAQQALCCMCYATHSQFFLFCVLLINWAASRR